MKLHVSIRPDGSVELQDQNNVPQAVMCYSGLTSTSLRAEHICRAVNSHDELLAQLQALAVQIELMGLIVPPGVSQAIAKATNS